MATRDNRPPQRICSGCRGKAWVQKPTRRVVNGKTVTEMVSEPCKTCGGVGWTNR